MRSVELNLSAAANPPDKRTAAGTEIPDKSSSIRSIVGGEKAAENGRKVARRRATVESRLELFTRGGRRRHRHRENTDVTGCRVINVLSAHAAPHPPSLRGVLLYAIAIVWSKSAVGGCAMPSAPFQCYWPTQFFSIRRRTYRTGIVVEWNRIRAGLSGRKYVFNSIESSSTGFESIKLCCVHLSWNV